jgi:hypothetical protein
METKQQKDWNNWYESVPLKNAINSVRNTFLQTFRINIPSNPLELSEWIKDLENRSDPSIYKAIILPKLNKLKNEIFIIQNFYKSQYESDFGC